MSLRFSQGSVGSSPSSRTGSLNIREVENEKGELKLSKLLESRVLTGFLRQYAESQYSVESLAFIQAEQDFQQHFADFEARGTVEEEVTMLWKKYLDDESQDSQICMTSEESSKVAELISNKKYSRNMFHFLVRLCKLTVERDIYPRFRGTRYYKDMLECMNEPVKPWVKELVPPATGCSKLLTPGEDGAPAVDLSDDSVRFTLDQILDDYVLARIFLNWVRQEYAGLGPHEGPVDLVEAVLMTLLYRETWSETSEESGDLRARGFGIYFLYLHPASEKRLSEIPKEVRHHVGSNLSLKKPPQDLFDELIVIMKTRVHKLLWEQFQASGQYAEMIKTLRKASTRTEANSASCSVM